MDRPEWRDWPLVYTALGGGDINSLASEFYSALTLVMDLGFYLSSGKIVNRFGTGLFDES
jgi:hypothetical protein